MLRLEQIRTVEYHDCQTPSTGAVSKQTNKVGDNKTGRLFGALLIRCRCRYFFAVFFTGDFRAFAPEAFAAGFFAGFSSAAGA